MFSTNDPATEFGLAVNGDFVIFMADDWAYTETTGDIGAAAVEVQARFEWRFVWLC